ncbi:MAG: SRPBCC family protein [Alphaproteobacteria bacterium]|nr:SRPBCC family protein [Alphaproteobacteria bacterium]
MRMFKLTLIAFAALIAWSAYAEAIDVRKRREAPGTPAEVWALVGGFCDIQKWHPAVAKCEESKDGDKLLHTLTLKDGAKILEEETKTAENSYSYTILEGPLPVKDYNATLTVGADDEPDRVEILWTASFEADGKSDEEAKKIVEGIFEAGVAGIKKAAIAAADAKEGKSE